MRLFCDGDSQGFGSGVHRSDGTGLLDGPLGEHIGLALQFAVLVQHFQRAQQIVGGIVGKGQTVAPVIDEAVFGGERVVQLIEPLLLPANFHGVRFPHL